MDEPSQPRDRAAQDRERTTTNIVLLAIVVVLVAIGVWLTDAMMDARRADECIAQGRRNCHPVDTTPR